MCLALFNCTPSSGKDDDFCIICICYNKSLRANVIGYLFLPLQDPFSDCFTVTFYVQRQEIAKVLNAIIEPQ